MKKLLYLAAASAAIMASCAKSPTWTLDATIDNADSSKIVLEAANPAGYWYALDTISVDDDGHFNAEHAAPQFPDIYRLNYGGRYIYFPIDSIEQLTLKANGKQFATDYELTGSDNAVLIAHVEKRLADFLAKHTVADLDTARTLKRELSGMILGNPSSIVSFYIVNRQIDGHRLFSTENRQDLGLIGAVANAYNEMRPGDPRTAFLKDLWLKNRAKFSTRGDTLAANQIGIVEITALDENGKEQKLSDVANKNRVVVLSFTNYLADYSQPINIELRELYNRHHGNGLEIYQLGFGSDEFQWRMAAGNLPWVTVYNGSTDTNVVNYNVGALPAIFIIKNGELVERLTDPRKVTSTVERYM